MATVTASAVGLQFRLLGPLEVWRDGRPIRLVGERQRGLLAALLLNANAVVSADRLIEDLYGSDPSGTAANALQAAVSRLRRQLDDESGEGILLTRPRGYLLRVAPEQLDLALFERLAEKGRQALAAGDAARAGVVLSEALALWRGPPLADLAALDFVLPSVRRLEEVRLAVLMDRVDADLAAGAGLDLVPELEALVQEHPLHERLRGQLMLSLYRTGRQADALSVFRETRAFLLEELGLEPSRELQRLERAILTQDESLDGLSARPFDRAGQAVCPFKGLAPFEIADGEFFCGRERIVADLVSLLAGTAFAGVIGASGVGKSSILRAGLLRSLSAGVLPGSDRWRFAIVRPGAHPLEALERALSGKPADALGLLPAGGRLVLAVDQLEEVFALCADERSRARFLEALVELATDSAARALVVVTLRADFYARCAEVSAFAELLSRRHVLVGSMARPELERAIELPAARAGIEVERELVDALLADLAGRAGGLPLLSTMLLELWRRREGSALRLAAYREAGGVQGAVARLAEQAYAELSPSDQEVARSVFLRLSVDDGETLVRRRVPMAELASEDDEAVRRVIDELVAGRLVTVDDGAVEVAHEAVLREWPRARQWLEEDQEGRRLHIHLAAAAQEWRVRGRDPADLYRGARLTAALDWAAAHDRRLNAMERDFLDASRRASDRGVRRLRTGLALVTVLLAAAVVAGAVALASRSHARREATAALAGRLGAEAVSEPRIDRAMLLAREAVRLDRTPSTEGTLLATLLRSPSALATFTGPIESRPQRLSFDPNGGTVAVSDNQGAVRFYDTSTRRVRAVVHDLGFTTQVTFAQDGSILVAPGSDGQGPVVDVRNGRTFRLIRRLPLDRRYLTHPTGAETALVLTADARTAYFAYDVLEPDGVRDGAAYVDRWDVRAGRLLGSVPVGAVGASDLRLVEHGRRLAVAGADRVTFLDPQTLARLGTRSLPARDAPMVALDPDGRTAAFSHSSGSVSFVDLRTGRMRAAGGTHAAPISGMSFSPDGRLLVSGAEDGSLIVWSVATGAPYRQLAGHASRILGIAFGREDSTLFTCSLDGAIFEWDLGIDRRFGRPFAAVTPPAMPHLGPDAQFHSPPLATSPDGARFAVRLGAERVALDSTTTGRATSSFAPGVGREVTGLAWSTRNILAVTGDDGRVRLWSLDRSPRLVRELHGLGSKNGLAEVVTAVAFSDDGSLVAAGDVNHTPQSVHFRYGTVAVWDSSSGRLLWSRRGRSGTVNALAFSPDRKTLAVGREDGTVALIDARTGAPRHLLHLDGGGDFSFETLAFSPTGTLATGTWAGIVQLWNPRTGAELGRPTLVAASPVASISLDRTGDRFVTTGGSDGLAKLWDTATLQQFGAAFTGDPGQWGTASFTRDSSTLIVAYDDQSGFVWPTSLQAWERHACAVAGRNLTPEEWLRFVGHRPYSETCSDGT